MTALMHYIIEGIENDRIKERIATWRENINDEFKCITCKEWLPLTQRETAPLDSLKTAPSCKECMYQSLLKAFIKNAEHIMESRCSCCGCIEDDDIGEYKTKWKTGEEHSITLCDDCRENKWVYLGYLDEYNDDCVDGCNCEICINKRRYNEEKELVCW